ncbi:MULTISPECIES: glycosyltransferase [unclassified Leifsonia]|uniref:glycosyltransferase n=1 Tax=unclassified Leifsonia TaxID=2663824 RepID=UPI0007021F26|nr:MULTISPECIES: glycosyltransferase [unclassified Leifsonia]KQX05666.1 hypothetical protein ASC59_16475 [Leifsonia sp. Root1293]KRA09302.1 hypothetical protein ASD61_16470 [Leifsonia sp. Root60]
MKVLVYYFGFPHYRQTIIEQLVQNRSANVDILSGSSVKASIATLTPADLPALRQVRSLRFGPFTWDVGAFSAAVAGGYDAAIVGPATTSLSTWAILFARRFRRRPTYLWGQCGRAGDRSLKRLFQEIMNRLAAGLLVYGEGEAAAAREWGTPASKVHVVRNATISNADVLARVDGAERYREMRRAAELASDGRMRLTFVGRVNADKRLSVLIEAGLALRERYPGISVDIVGEGDEFELLRRRFDQDFVHFHGWVYDRNRLDTIFEESTLVVSPQHMGLLAVDALRAGIPVLVPDNPQNASEVEALTLGVNSLTFKRSDAMSLAAVAEAWLAGAASIDESAFIESREVALRAWEPSAVSDAILSVLAADRPRSSTRAE